MSADRPSLLLQASAVAFEGRALLIEGAPGVGKSSLALALIDRGAQLIGDDGVTLSRVGEGADQRLIASPPPNIEGMLEVRGVGLARCPLAKPAPAALLLTLLGQNEPDGDRLPERAGLRSILGCDLPALPFRAGAIAPAQRALMALRLHGLHKT